MAKADKTATAAKNAEGARQAREARKQHEEERRAAGKVPGVTVGSPAGRTKAETEKKAKTGLEAARKKETAEADAKAVAKVEKELVSVAKEVNVRLEKANKLIHDADDHRLAAALRLAEAKRRCEEVDISFKAWAEANIAEQSYENVRKLAYVGSQDDPKQALADLRTRTKKAVEAHREKAKSKSSVEPAKLTGPAKSPFIVAEESIAKLNEKDTLTLLENRARKLGMAVMSEAEAKALAKAAEPSKGPTLAAAKEVFSGLKAAEKMTFLKWAAAEIGASVDTGAFEQAIEQANAEPADGSPPAFLRRKPSRRAPAAEASASPAA